MVRLVANVAFLVWEQGADKPVWFLVLVLGRFKGFHAPTHLIEWTGRYQASAALDDELIIGFRCVGAGERPKAAAQTLL